MGRGGGGFIVSVACLHRIRFDNSSRIWMFREERRLTNSERISMTLDDAGLLRAGSDRSERVWLRFPTGLKTRIFYIFNSNPIENHKPSLELSGVVGIGLKSSGLSQSHPESSRVARGRLNSSSDSSEIVAPIPAPTFSRNLDDLTPQKCAINPSLVPNRHYLQIEAVCGAER